MWKSFSAALVALAIGTVAAAASPAWQPSMRAADWHWRFSPGMHGPVQAGKGWSFAFPFYAGPLPCATDQSCAGAHYLATEALGPIAGKALVATGWISARGNPAFEHRTEPGNTGHAAAAFRFFIQAAGDDCLCQDYGRWWSNPRSVKLQPGAFRLAVGLAPRNWTSVFGHRGSSSPAARAGFAAALAHPARMGFAFGGGNYFSHGVNLRGGSARMTVTAVHIKR